MLRNRLELLRCYLTFDTVLIVEIVLPGSRLDYCNSLFRRISDLDLHKMQCVQDSLARIVSSTTKYSHIAPVRKTVYWLPIEHCSVFTLPYLCTSSYKVVIPNIWNLFLNLGIVCTI